MKKIAIYLAYAPGQDIRNQGLGRLLAFILKGANESNTAVTLCYPKWYKAEINNLLLDNQLDKSSYSHIMTRGIPFIIRVKMLIDGYFKNRKKTGFFKNIINGILTKSAKLFLDLMSMRNPILPLIIGILAVIIGFFSIPLVAVGVGIFFLSKKVVPKLKKNKYLQIIFLEAKLSVKNNFAATIFAYIRKKELKRLNRRINRNKDIHAVLIPTIFWPECSGLKAKKVVVVPDIIFVDFPTQFDFHMMKRSFHNINEVIACADHYITYSNYVKENHLQKRFMISGDMIDVIPHGNISLAEQLGTSNPDDIINDFQREHLQSNPYLADICLTELRYIFYSSQIRPHKNFMNLIKAYEILLRKRFVNIKLIITAKINERTPEYEYIHEHALTKDIISLHNVSSKVLAALNAKAVCAVNPTLFEGGFPFTFLEAYSVGTPSIMSNIPMTSEMIKNQSLRNLMLFDPLSLEDIVNKIEYGVNNRTTMLEAEKELFDELSQRSWGKVANEYIRVIENV